MGQGDLDQFGPIVIATALDAAVKNTLQEWMPTYQRFIEREGGLASEWLPKPRSYTISSDFTHYPEEQLPALLIMSKELSKPRMDGRKEYRVDAPFCIGAFVSAKDRNSSEALAKYFGAVIRALIVQKGGLANAQQREKGEPGLAVTTEWTGEKFDVHESDTSKRTIGTVEVEFVAEIRQVVQRLGGPKEPLPAPQAEPSPWPTVNKLTPVKIDPEPE
jgi:hypothetical protein